MSTQEDISEKMRNRAELSMDAEGKGAKNWSSEPNAQPMNWEEEKVLMYSRLLYVKYMCCNSLNSQ